MLYAVITRKQLRPMRPPGGTQHSRERWHRWALATPFAQFPILYFLPWNVIDAGIAAMVAGAVATIWCRPDRKSNALVGEVLIHGLPLQELLFEFAFGLFWAGIYEHFTARRSDVSPGLSFRNVMRAPASCRHWQATLAGSTWASPVVVHR